MQWIKFSKQKPEHGKWIIAFCKIPHRTNYYIICFNDKINNQFIDTYDYAIANSDISHWLEFPLHQDHKKIVK